MRNVIANIKRLFQSIHQRVGIVVHLLQLVYILSWVLLFVTLYARGARDTIIQVAWCVLIGISIIRAGTLIALAKGRHKIFNILVYIEFIILGVIFVITFIPSIVKPDYPVPIRRAVTLIFFAYCGVFMDYRLDQRRIKYGLLNGILYGWGLIATQLCHMIYKYTPDVQTVVNKVFAMLLPEAPTPGVIAVTVPWLSLGLPLFGSCLIIINWFKERPSKDWNPYTVQQIGLSDHVVYFAVVCLISLFYCFDNGMNRAPVIPITGLVFLNVYALYLRNAQNLDGPVMRRIISRMKVQPLIVLIQKEEKDRENDRTQQFSKKTRDIMRSFSCSIRDIMNTILTSETSLEIKTSNYMEVVSHVYALLPTGKKYKTIHCTIGFLLGLSSAPPWYKKSDDKIQIDDFVKAVNETISRKRFMQLDFYKMLISGISAGQAKALLYSIHNSSEKRKEEVWDVIIHDDPSEKMGDKTAHKDIQKKLWMKKEIGEKKLSQYNDAIAFLNHYTGHIPEDKEKGEKMISSEERFYNWLVQNWLDIESKYSRYATNDCWKWVDEIWDFVR